MPARLIGIEAFRAELRAKRRPAGGVFRVSTEPPAPADDGSRKVRFCFSDGSVDRMGDTIDPDGWDITDFERNPVALWAHDSSAPPIGRAGNVAVEGDRLMGDIAFIPPETYAFADTIYRMVIGGFLNAVSVGFLPTEYVFVENQERPWGIDFRKQQLLEISVCPIPANPQALVDARAKGIDTRPLVEWAEATLEGGGKLAVPRAELERLRRIAKELPLTGRRTGSGSVRRDTDDGDGMTEQEPAAGGAVVGNCGRPLDAECGMKDQAECSIHGFGGVGTGDDDGDDEKTLARTVRRLILEELDAVAKIKPIRRDDGGAGDDGTRPDVTADHERSIRMCAMHMKAMGDCLTAAGEYHGKALSALDEALKSLEATPPADDGLSAEDDPEAEKALRLRIAENLRRKFAAAS